MKLPHLLRVTLPPDHFATLIEAARALKLRIGWLDWPGTPGESPAPSSSLEVAADLGVLRAVAVEEGKTVSVKPLRGRPVLKDLLREHFLGCALVLVRGEVDAPGLDPDGDGWSLQLPGISERASRRLTTSDLAEALRKPRPWG
ncbi:MAG TPA: hypothetical protein VGS07_02480 [Thermoanaerobaculia bacterium]|jgi:hypothetical protein|nr:hypothetical protein [Thermoanaerobaculia bacterium]